MKSEGSRPFHSHQPTWNSRLLTLNNRLLASTVARSLSTVACLNQCTFQHLLDSLTVDCYPWTVVCWPKIQNSQFSNLIRINHEYHYLKWTLENIIKINLNTGCYKITQSYFTIITTTRYPKQVPKYLSFLFQYLSLRVFFSLFFLAASFPKSLLWYVKTSHPSPFPITKTKRVRGIQNVVQIWDIP